MKSHYLRAHPLLRCMLAAAFAAFAAFAALLAAPLPLAAQAAAEGEPEPTNVEVPVSLKDQQNQALESISISIERVTKELQNLKKQRGRASSDLDRSDLSALIDEKKAKLSVLEAEFVEVVGNVDDLHFDSNQSDELSLKNELNALIQPVIGELKEATAAPREAEQLRANIEQLRQQHLTAKSIVRALEEKLKEDPPVGLKSQLEQSLSSWQENLSEADRKLQVLEYQFSERDSRSVSVLDSVSNIVRKFFKSRGLHLFIAVLSFALVFYLIQKGYALFRQMSPIHKNKTKSLSIRLVDLSFYVLGFVLSVLAAMLSLYLVNDWVLLTLSILFLLGSFWVGKQSIPKVYEQAKLILNLGAVREGERVIYDGIPWLVERIHVYSILTNPALDGGEKRLPIKDLLDLRSRVFDSEPWFPTAKGDWVLLSDGTFGKVLQQTPEHVEMIKHGGSHIFIPIASFLGASPENLSKNFRVKSVFGIDYMHQELATTEIPKIFEARLKVELEAIVGAKAIKNISVQFSSAGASSLDYEILADFAGDVATKFLILTRAIQRICVDVCNENDWVIPFTQITVHQANPDTQ